MGRESNCYCVKMLNSDMMELDAEIVETLEKAKQKLLEMIEQAVLAEGDFFCVQPAWSEQYEAAA